MSELQNKSKIYKGLNLLAEPKDLQQGESPDLNDMIVEKVGRIRSRRGYSKVINSAFVGPVWGIYDYFKSTGEESAIAMTDDDINTFTDDPEYLIITETEYLVSNMFEYNDKLYIVSLKDTQDISLYIYDLNDDTSAETILNTSVTGKGDLNACIYDGVLYFAWEESVGNELYMGSYNITSETFSSSLVLTDSALGIASGSRAITAGGGNVFVLYTLNSKTDVYVGTVQNDLTGWGTAIVYAGRTAASTTIASCLLDDKLYVGIRQGHTGGGDFAFAYIETDLTGAADSGIINANPVAGRLPQIALYGGKIHWIYLGSAAYDHSNYRIDYDLTGNVHEGGTDEVINAFSSSDKSFNIIVGDDIYVGTHPGVAPGSETLIYIADKTSHAVKKTFFLPFPSPTAGMVVHNSIFYCAFNDSDQLYLVRF